jgi:N-acetyl sugar amidotransferase
MSIQLQHDPLEKVEAAAGTGGRTRPYQVCVRCIMDTSDPDIEFDAGGVCNHCKTYFQRMETEVHRGPDAEIALADLADRIRQQGKNKPYDCIIGVSGGVDSTYVAYLVKEKLGLRPLAVHLDNGWNSELAVDNIKRALDTLNIDLKTQVLNWEMFRDLQLSFLKSSVSNLEIPTDHAITALLFDEAMRQGVRYIVAGSNVATEAIYPAAWEYPHYDFKFIHSIHKRFGTQSLATYPRLSLPKLAYCVFVRQIRYVPLLNYVHYSRRDAMQLLTEHLGWRPYGDKHYESIYTRWYQGYYLPTKFGIDKRRAYLSCHVLAGDMTRQDALEQIAQPPYAGWNIEQDTQFVMKKLGLSEDAMRAILNAPTKTHADYPSNAWLLLGLVAWKQRFKRIAMRA